MKAPLLASFLATVEPGAVCAVFAGDFGFRGAGLMWHGGMAEGGAVGKAECGVA